MSLPNADKLTIQRWLRGDDLPSSSATSSNLIGVDMIGPMLTVRNSALCRFLRDRTVVGWHIGIIAARDTNARLLAYLYIHNLVYGAGFPLTNDLQYYGSDMIDARAGQFELVSPLTLLAWRATQGVGEGV